MDNMFAHKIASMAQKAILYEVGTTCKPGLVDPNDTGAHRDMDFFTFLSSGTALYKGMYEFVIQGSKIRCESEVLEKIRPIGIKCEEDMFRATAGVNTHKGMIFSMGLLCSAAGFLQDKSVNINAHNICQCVREITRGLSQRDFKGIEEKKELTKGEYFFLNHGIKGIRGEVEEGFPTVCENALPILLEWNREKSTTRLKKNDILLETLLRIMGELEDTNILSRGGFESLEYVRLVSRDFINAGGMKQAHSIKKLASMNDEFIKRNISPGGAADLLAVAIFLGEIEGIDI